ncbi:MAG TPA: F0F1 ATP synthase subunit B [Candidatus Cloacimonadota bacterium]|jgi:F-type H+-transporting ATPase subunit b|nr:F0F1 ATP synthase subunit B [Candidatus Cloacimonadales bacterium]HPY95668.1 F0F1 ATP synthase subunit B [Candidatus Cloacimonadota bacterium]HQB40340.1 F0F1 ATP synthase subunit B [Candidatus Cloacimonadota bacterium]
MTVDFTLVLVILNFILLMIVLNNLLYKPLKKFLVDRQSQIKTDMEEAQKSIEVAQELAKQREAELKSAMDEARKLKDSIRLEAEKQAVNLIETAKIQEKEILKQAETRLKQEVKLAVKTLETEVSQMVIDLSEQFVKGKMDKETDKIIIDKMISERSMS